MLPRLHEDEELIFRGETLALGGLFAKVNPSVRARRNELKPGATLLSLRGH